jgi:hypothetical protein
VKLAKKWRSISLVLTSSTVNSRGVSADALMHAGINSRTKLAQELSPEPGAAPLSSAG